MILLGFLPAILLLIFVCYRDRQQPEPLSRLLLGVGYGVLSIILTFVFVGIMHLFRPPLDQLPVIGNIFVAFYDAAIPEESAKLLMLWLLLRRNPYFDEHLDGIIYAVCVGMGFAAFENVGYLFSNQDTWLEVAVARALLAVPGHYAFAVLMGFFYSLVHFYPARYRKYRYLVWLAPVMAHGIYDSLCFLTDGLPVLSGVITLFLYFFCYLMHRFCLRRITNLQLLDQDRKDLDAFSQAMR